MYHLTIKGHNSYIYTKQLNSIVLFVQKKKSPRDALGCRMGSFRSKWMSNGSKSVLLEPNKKKRKKREKMGNITFVA